MISKEKKNQETVIKNKAFKAAYIIIEGLNKIWQKMVLKDNFQKSKNRVSSADIKWINVEDFISLITNEWSRQMLQLVQRTIQK